MTDERKPRARIASFLRDWSLPRQLAGQDHETAAARSSASETLRPRLETADRVGTSICPYCAVGCAQLVYAKNGRVIHVEGDPRSPINEGTLCPKGAATFSLLANPDRLTTVRYRAPFSRQWEDKPLDWAMERIAQLVKRTRDETFVRTLPDGETVNHTLAIGSLGGATLDNEENYLIKKVFGGGLGIVAIENQARICHANSVPGLGSSWGRGAATMPQWDLANSDCVLVMGSNMAEAHPIAFRFVLQAKQRGATIVHVDPRFTRTSALCDLYAPIRAGTDIAFLGGIVRHLLENDLWFREYALAYTNLSTIIDDGFQGPNELDGMFSGWQDETRSYQHDSWIYKDTPLPPGLVEHYLDTAESFGRSAGLVHDRPPPRDESLQHPNCVYQIMKRHYAAYTPEMVESVTGCPREVFLKVADALARNSGRDKTAAIAYAVGWNHHSIGVQMIRAATIVQSLLGNVGRPGGGIIALRGHCSIQGSTDIPTLYNMLPSYMPQPHAMRDQPTLHDYLQSELIPTGWWHNFPKYVVSLLRAWYGDAANAGNDFGYGWLPKIVGDHSQLPMTLAMKDGLIRGLFLLGQNVVLGGSNSKLIQQGLARLEWLVVRDTAEVEAASFWYRGHAVRDDGLRPEDIGTEVFLMPAALAGEKDGTFTNTHRLVQWHDKVVDAPGDSRSELWFVHHLGKRLKALYADSDDPKDDAIKAITLDYPVRGVREEPAADEVLKEINGYTWPGRRQLEGPDELEDDGSTACGSWLYAGAFPRSDHNQTRSREPDGADGPGTHLNWAFAWPANRRTLYNRASADPNGKPWSEAKRLMSWDEAEGKWVGADVIDFEISKPPHYRPDWPSTPTGMDAIGGADPFILMPDGRGHLFVPSGLKEGPLPTHYEPIESPLRNPMYGQQSSPTAKRWARADNPLHETADPRFPHVLTTYRLTEHHTGGTGTRAVPTTAELQPEGFAELPPELARELRLENLDWIVIATARGEIETKALVTQRLRPLEIDGRRVYQIGMPWHFGWAGYATGDIANVLTAVVGDANTSMHENKALTCALRKGRLRGEAVR
ncbi:MAG: molybdopterin-dependent oxidoreductase [Limnobacter sp.]|nr:molybdopterin-dependent oxidoreductase [Limnobacter sp.]